MSRPVKRHLLVILALTVLIRGVMFVSYPLGGRDDNQAAQRYLIDELNRGNLLIGNLRYNTGYPLVIAPIIALSHLFGRLDERFVLVVQVTLSSAIPFLVYDLIRRRRGRREAFVVALVVLLDPFGWQWAHFWLPEWLTAFAVVVALWMICRHSARRVQQDAIGLDSEAQPLQDDGVTQRAGSASTQRRRLVLAGAAGVVLGLATLARLNILPVVAVFGLALLVLPGASFGRRLRFALAYGLGASVILVVYLAFIHYPSTGTWTPSCIGGVNLLNSLLDKAVPIQSGSGPASAELTQLLSLQSDQELAYLADSYPRWQTPGPWTSAEELAAFFARPSRPVESGVLVAFPGEVIAHLGPCPTDALFRAVHAEAVQTYPSRWFEGVARATAAMLVQRPSNVIETRYLTGQAGGQGEIGPLGLRRAEGGAYSGQWVWEPGMRLYARLFEPLQWLKWLTPFAVLWAIVSREWVYMTAALMLVTFVVATAFLTQVEPRYYAAVYPLAPMLLGGLLARGLAWAHARRGRAS